MAEKNHFYITTTLPYVNSDPHIGFAMEIIRADIVARFKKQQGFKVFFNTGTDEHGVKIYRKAVETGKTPQEYVDEYAEKFKNLKSLLGLSDDIHFIRTTDADHVHAAKEFWKRCKEAGFIYKKNYKIKYCVGCELEKTESELVNGRCPLHPNLELELIEEENYFFKFSEFQKPLLQFYDKNPDFVIPDFRYNEIKAFVGRGLEDFSISRLKSKMPWGIEVPDDPEHTIYVWFDALVSYIAAIGWPDDEKNFNKWWPVTQYCGKDNLRQQSAMFQAMLMSIGLPNSKQIVIEGFITSAGVKMSKSLGNVIDPYKVVEEFGTDALRYYVSRELHPFEDGDFTMEKFKDVYNANLANGLGNLFSRVMKMATMNNVSIDTKKIKIAFPYTEEIEHFKFNNAADLIWKKIGEADAYVQKTEPFKTIKTDKEKALKDIQYLLEEVYKIGRVLEPFLPETAEKITSAIENNKIPESPLFPRMI